jgi:hypothetical protein
MRAKIMFDCKSGIERRGDDLATGEFSQAIDIEWRG